MEWATFGAGCFWGVEELYRRVPGVTSTAVGYMGGTTQYPTYEQVCTDTTGHAEVVHLSFDPSQVSYDTLVHLFFKLHDPTTLNRQGPDIGTQYRSVIFTHSPEQEKIAQSLRHALQNQPEFAHKTIVTQIESAPEFWPAEDYHQQYFAKRGIEPTCHLPV